MRLTARVPATSANLGPGFDCFGLALDLCNEITVDTEAEPGVSWEGEGAEELPTDGSDLTSRAMRHVYALVSNGGAERPPLHLHGTNRIPLASGLGSSSAAAVAGVALAYALLDPAQGSLDLETIFTVAAELEGHPDNAAAAVFGGFTIAVPDGSVRRLEPHPDLRPVALVPEGVRVPTAEARRVLPEVVSLEDAAYNAGHAALTVEALTTDPDRLWSAMRDRLHQDVRLGLAPVARELFDRLSREEVPACVSGAGPTILAFERRDRGLPDPGEGWRVLRLPVRGAGIEVVGF